MTIFRRSLILAAALIGATSFAQGPIERENPYDFRHHIRDTSEWKLANQLSVKLKMEGKNTVIEDGRGNSLLEINAPDYVRQVCRAPEGGCLVFAIWNTDDGRGSDYSELIVIRAMDSELKVSHIFESGDEAVSKDRWWLSELGAVSESGDRILAEFGEMPEESSWVVYRWQTWQVSPPVRLGIGLQISNGQIHNDSEEHVGAGNPASNSESDSEGGDKPDSESRQRLD